MGEEEKKQDQNKKRKALENIAEHIPKYHEDQMRVVWKDPTKIIIETKTWINVNVIDHEDREWK